jgi:transposase
MNDKCTTIETVFFVIAAAGVMNQQLYRMVELQSRQIGVLKGLLGKRPRVAVADRRVLARMADEIDRHVLDLSEHIVSVDSLRRWYRELTAATYTAKKRGRPPLNNEQKELVIRLATENPDWGEDTIAQRMRELGHDVSDRTVGRLLKTAGIPPAPERQRQQANDWSAFIEDNFAHVVAVDCATWEVPDPAAKRTRRCAGSAETGKYPSWRSE